MASLSILRNQLNHQLDVVLPLIRIGTNELDQHPRAGPDIPPGTIILQQISSVPDASGRIKVLAWRTERGGGRPLVIKKQISCLKFVLNRALIKLPLIFKPGTIAWR